MRPAAILRERTNVASLFPELPCGSLLMLRAAGAGSDETRAASRHIRHAARRRDMRLWFASRRFRLLRRFDGLQPYLPAAFLRHLVPQWQWLPLPAGGMA